MIEETFVRNAIPYKEYPFDVHGADERQFSSQAFRINVGTICQDRYHEYPEYHSSADNLELVTAGNMAASFDIYTDVIGSLEKLDFFVNKEPHGEVMLSKHNLYTAIGGSIRPKEGQKSELQLILWLLFYLDGHMPLSKVARKLQVSEDTLRPLVDTLVALDILERV